MEAKVITLPLLHVVGYRIESNITEFESGLIKNIALKGAQYHVIATFETA